MKLKDHIFDKLSITEKYYLRSRTPLTPTQHQINWFRDNINTDNVGTEVPRLYLSDFEEVPNDLNVSALPTSVRRCLAGKHRPVTTRQMPTNIANILWPAADNPVVPETIAPNTVNTYEQQDDLQTTIHDLELRYSRCLFTFKGNVCYATYFYIDGTCIKVEYREVTGKGLSSGKVLTYTEDIAFVVPKQGYVNTPKYCLFLERAHKKDPGYKYKRGFHEKSFVICDISHREALCLGQEYVHNKELDAQSNILIKLSPNIIYREFPSYEEALRKVVNFESLSCAFSTSLAIKLDSLSNRIVLLKNRWIIGEYSKDLFKLNTNTFNEELTRLNIPFEASDEDR